MRWWRAPDPITGDERTRTGVAWFPVKSKRGLVFWLERVVRSEIYVDGSFGGNWYVVDVRGANDVAWRETEETQK